MSRLIRAGLLAFALPSLYAGIALLLHPPGASAAVLAVRPGPIDRPLHLTAADFDRDGYDDLAVANFRAGTLTILINQKDGTFAPQKDSPFSVGAATIGNPTAGPLFLVAGDLDPEDVDADRVGNDVDNCPNVYNPADVGGLQLDTGNLGVGDACRTSTADSDGDGVPDYNSTTHVLDNCPLIANPGQQPEAAAGADGTCWTADDNFFLFGPDGLCGTPDDKESKVGTACTRSADLVIVETSVGGGSSLGVVRVRVNDGVGGMRSRTSLQMSAGPAQALLADFNTDRRPDLVVSNSGTDALLLFPGAADGEFGTTQVITAGDGPEGLAAGDFDGDGDTDLAVANRTAGTIGLYLNGGTALPSTASSTLTTRPGPTSLLASPLKNGDTCAALVALDQGLPTCSGGTNDGKFCKTDLDCPGGGTVSCQSAGSDVGTIEVFTNPACAPGGSLGLTSTINLGAGRRPRGGAFADLDGDGSADLAVADFTGGQVLLYRGDGSGGFSPAAQLTGLSSPAALALLNYDPDMGPALDLAVLSFTSNRVDLFHNDSVPGTLSFSGAPNNPASPWKSITAMSIFPADASVGQDLVMLNSSPPRLDVLSGTGTTFRVLPPEPLAAITTASAMAVADLRQDGVLDLLVLDGPGRKAEVLTSEPTGVQIEQGDLCGGSPLPCVGVNPVSAAIEPLVLHGDDYDKDGVPNLADNCPTRYNPPACPAYDPGGHPECFLDTPCKTQQDAFDTCDATNADGQCDSDADGIGDQCEMLDEACLNVDTDLDNVPDYDQVTNTIDNCPWKVNSGQDDADGDRIGDVCDDSACLPFIQECSGGPKNLAACLSDDDCEAPVNDIATVNAGDGTLSLLIGDTSGTFRPAPASWSTLSGFSNPVAAHIGHFSFNCITLVLFGTDCTSRPQNDIVVAEKGATGDVDDTLKLFIGDGAGAFTPPSAPVAAQAALQGDPSRLLLAPAQRVCPNPWATVADPRFRFDKDRSTAVLAAVEPVTSTLGILLPGSQGLVAPPANPIPLPLSSPPVDALFVDLNQDGAQDLVALSSGDFDPATPNTNITVYVGLGNGLFFTDPTLNPADVPDGMTHLAAGNINLSTDSTYPDVALFSGADQAPIILTNVLIDRADIDDSGRVDGYDLAVLARSFGAERGENFTLLADGTFLQAGTGPTKALVPGGCVLQEGFDLPQRGATGVFLCDRALSPMTSQNANYCDPGDPPLNPNPNYLNPGSSLYGLPVDINLDGKVDGTDLALLASRFGRTL